MAKKRKVVLRRAQREPSPDSSDYKSESEAEEPSAQLGADYSDGGDVSDRELQAAFEAGMLSEGMVKLDTDKPRPPINKKVEMKQKIFQIKKKLPWEGTLDVVFDESLQVEDEQDDLERETAFYKQAMDAVQKSIPKLEEAGIPIFRPDDYFAEMSKSDSHMQRVRERLLEVQKDKERSENARRLRDEKKFAQKVQTAALERKQLNKKKLAEAVKSHRKGMKAQLETMLNNASKLDADEKTGGRRAKMSRVDRNKKFGYGGQKKRSKRNDLESLNSVYKPKKGGIRKKR